MIELDLNPTKKGYVFPSESIYTIPKPDQARINDLEAKLGKEVMGIHDSHPYDTLPMVKERDVAVIELFTRCSEDHDDCWKCAAAEACDLCFEMMYVSGRTTSSHRDIKDIRKELYSLRRNPIAWMARNAVEILNLKTQARLGMMRTTTRMLHWASQQGAAVHVTE